MFVNCIGRSFLELQNLWNEYLCWNLLEWLTGLSPTNPIMVNCEWKVQESNSLLVPQILAISDGLLYLLEIERSRSQSLWRKSWADMVRQVDKKKKSFFHALILASSSRCGLTKGISSSFKIWIKGMCFPTSRSKSEVCLTTPKVWM